MMTPRSEPDRHVRRFSGFSSFSDMANGKFIALILALWLAEIVGSFETAMIFAAQRPLIEELGDTVRFGWLVTSYLVIAAGMAAIVGRLGDMFGRRNLLIVALLTGLVGSLMSAWATSYPMLLGGRCLQGVTGAALPLCIGLAREHCAPERVPLVIGLVISGASIGTAMGLVIGGVIVDQFSWHGVFYASALLSLLAVPVLLLAIPAAKATIPHRSVDWIGGILFAPAVLLVLLGITNGSRWGFLSPWTFGCLAVGLVLLLVWIVSSLRSEKPLIDIRLLGRREVWVSNLSSSLVAMSALQITLVFSLMLQAPVWTGIGLGLSATMAGLTKLPSNFSSLFAGPFTGWLTSRWGGRLALLVSGGLTVAGWLLAVFFNGSVAQLIVVLIVISFGTTMLLTTGMTIVSTAVPVDRTSEAIGMMSVFRGACMGIGAQLVSLLLATSTVTAPSGGAAYPTPTAFMLAIGFIIVLCGAATVLALLLPRDAGLRERLE
ncbi:MAG: MFS transporter [Novosphingobium sp.]|nr:MFS transporter [Novosphingobium sp.]